MHLWHWLSLVWMCFDLLVVCPPSLATWLVVSSFLSWSLFLLLLGVVLGFILGKSFSSFSSKGSAVAMNGVKQQGRRSERASEGSMEVEASAASQSSAQRREKKGLPEMRRKEELEMERPEADQSGVNEGRELPLKSERTEGFQSRRELAKPIGEIERRRQRFADAQRGMDGKGGRGKKGK